MIQEIATVAGEMGKGAILAILVGLGTAAAILVPVMAVEKIPAILGTARRVLRRIIQG